MKNGFIIGSISGLFLNEFLFNNSNPVLSWSRNPLDSFLFASFHSADVVKSRLVRHGDLLVLDVTLENGDLLLSPLCSIRWRSPLGRLNALA